MSILSFSNYIGFDATITVTDVRGNNYIMNIGSGFGNYQRSMIFDQEPGPVDIQILTGKISNVFQSSAVISGFDPTDRCSIQIFASRNDNKTYISKTFEELPKPTTIPCSTGSGCKKMITPTTIDQWVFADGEPDTKLYVQCSTINYKSDAKCSDDEDGYLCVSIERSTPVNVVLKTSEEEPEESEEPEETPTSDSTYFDSFIEGLGSIAKYVLIFIMVIIFIVVVAVVGVLVWKTTRK